ncbi:unnamed protein product [Effrenium voratum]|uniref:tRNA-uridine aminocarboxypropyltransferase n=1 Tax=Effrenium voratum TaxID=2562239 RepID=A0AA36I0M6_9DINO|nr:unnamed protein product [Effrenium voratum]
MTASVEALEQPQESDLIAASPQDRERARSEKAWASFQAFLESPGDKCPRCWLMRRHCCCAGLPVLEMRLKVFVLMHHLEIGQRKASNTAKLLLHFGAELLCWGVEEHDSRLQQVIQDDEEGTVVLFPSESAIQAQSLAEAPRQVVVLDGGWRECIGCSCQVTREKRDPRLQLASGGAAQLAEQVAEELKDWKKKRENAYAQRRHVREKLHRDAVQGKRQEEQDKQKVRDFVREVLFDVAKHALSSGTAKGIPPVSARTSSGLETEDPHGSISAGAPALLLLRSRLGSLVERLEATDAPPPAEMVQAAALAKEALNRKRRERMKAASLKHRFAELTHGADQELLDEAELGFEQRHSVLQNLSDHLRQVVNSLRASVDHRQQAFSELDAANRGPASQAPKAWWKALNDDQETETELESVRPCLAEGDEPSEEFAAAEAGARLGSCENRAELCQSFQRRYSRADASHEAWMAESQLEAWKLRARLELLQELRREAQAWHQKKLTSLQLLQESMVAEKVRQRVGLPPLRKCSSPCRQESTSLCLA